MSRMPLLYSADVREVARLLAASQEPDKGDSYDSLLWILEQIDKVSFCRTYVALTTDTND